MVFNCVIVVVIIIIIIIEYPTVPAGSKLAQAKWVSCLLNAENIPSRLSIGDGHEDSDCVLFRDKRIAKHGSMGRGI